MLVSSRRLRRTQTEFIFLQIHFRLFRIDRYQVSFVGIMNDQMVQITERNKLLFLWQPLLSHVSRCIDDLRDGCRLLSFSVHADSPWSVFVLFLRRDRTNLETIDYWTARKQRFIFSIRGKLQQT